MEPQKLIMIIYTAITNISSTHITIDREGSGRGGKDSKLAASFIQLAHNIVTLQQSCSILNADVFQFGKIGILFQCIFFITDNL